MTKQLVRFDDAWAIANDFIQKNFKLNLNKIVLIRDVFGKLYIAFDEGSDKKTKILDYKKLAKSLHVSLGAFSPGLDDIFQLSSEMFLSDDVFKSPDAVPISNDGPSYRVLDRSLMGADWIRPPFSPKKSKRVTLFGIKGGVGRSTSGAVLAWKLSAKGKKVLIVDLDLESPGIGSTLLQADQMPKFGIVDWFVESAVGQVDDSFYREIVGQSPLGSTGAGITIVPANGKIETGYSYLPKLSRTYIDINDGEKNLEFSDRISILISELEKRIKPDITILDSRAGLHDIAATSITRLGSTSLLFGFDNYQTWAAYSALFDNWHRFHDRANNFKTDLKMVAAQVPETNAATYLEEYRQNSYSIFEKYLYEQAGPTDTNSFNFDVNDSEAPHFPLRINWSRSFQQFDPVNKKSELTEEQIESAFGEFVREISMLTFGEAI